MTVLDTLNFVAFNPLANNNPIAIRRRKLMAKIDIQNQLATNKDYTPTQHKWVNDDVAFYCGTSVKQIESTYYHLNEEKMRAVATARFVRKDGKIYALGKEIAED